MMAGAGAASGMDRNDRPHGMDVRMFELLVCPLTRGPLVYDATTKELRSSLAGLAYPVRDGIPVMLPAEARRIAEEPEGDA